MDLRLFGTETIEEASRRQLDSKLAAAIEDQPCRTKATRLCLRAACKPSLSSERLESTSVDPSTETTLKLFVAMPSLLQAHTSIDTMS